MKNDWEGFCAYLLLNHRRDILFSLFQECSCFYWVNSNVFSIFRRPVFGYHSDFSQNEYLGCTVQNSHCHISASGRSFLSFKVVNSCLLICSDIPDGSYVSIMGSLWRHTDICKLVHTKTPAGFDESLPCKDPFFVIWSAQWSLLSTWEPFLFQTKRLFHLPVRDPVS